MEILFIFLFVLFFVGLVGFVTYCIKGGNLVIGFVTTALFWTILAITYQIAVGVYAGEINSFRTTWNAIIGVIDTHFNDAIIAYGTVAATMIVAAWFGRVIVDTGIAKSIIKKVAELSGDRQMLTVMLISVVNALIFTSIFGPGAVIAMGVIILPIFFSIGVKKPVAIGALIMSVAAGMFVNPGLTGQFTSSILFRDLFNVDNSYNIINEFTLFGWLAFVINIVVTCLFIFVALHFSKDKISAWSMTDDMMGDEEEQITTFAYFVPFFPAVVTLAITIINIFLEYPILNIGILTLFLFGIILALLSTKNLKSLRKATNVVQKTLYNALTDIALLLGMLLALQIFNASANGSVRPLFHQIVGDNLNWLIDYRLVVLIVFMVLAPLALFRGPLTFFGAGAAFAAILAVVFTPEGGYAAVNYANLAFVFLIFFVPSIGIGVQMCPTQSWVLWTIQYSKEEPKMLFRNYLVWAWIASAAILLVGYIVLL